MNHRISAETHARILAAWPALLSRIAGDGMVRAAITAAGFTPDMMRAFRDSSPALRAEWESAREQSGDAFAERALEMALEPCQIIAAGAPGNEKGTEPLVIRLEPAHARNAIDTLKWAAKTRNPRVYSDKAVIDMNIRTVDLTRIISEAAARLAAHRAGRVLEHESAALDMLSAPADLAALL